VSELKDPIYREDWPDSPPYLERCKRMTFVELRKFIDHALKRLMGPSSLDDEELPRSEPEFLVLCEMLTEKADALKEPPILVPERPVYDGPERPSSFFIPSDELSDLYEKREPYARRVEEAIEEGWGKYFVEHLKSELEEVERSIALIEGREKQAYQQHVKAYYEARKVYTRDYQIWETRAKMEQKRREAEASRERIVNRIYRDVGRALDPQEISATPGRLQWRPLAAGESSLEHVLRLYGGLRREGRLRGFDEDRLRKAFSLRPKKYQVGIDGFDGYIIFQFDHTPKALMECPLVGNAIYIISADWERWSRMTKQDLMADQSGAVRKIVHQGDWFGRVQQELGQVGTG
jgi:hypothetical protein